MDDDTFASLHMRDLVCLDRLSNDSALPHVVVRDWSWPRHRDWRGLGKSIHLSMTAGRSIDDDL